MENLTGDAIAKLYVTKFPTISLYLTKLYVSLAMASSVTYSETHNFSNSLDTLKLHMDNNWIQDNGLNLKKRELFVII